jgi:urease accessory protein
MTSASGWRGELRLRYHRRGERTVAFDAHTGPLRVLQPLYPEGDGVCHHVLVHPPGGVVGGDELHVQVQAEAGSHALLTTPGATRFYRSEGAQALQHTRLQLAEGARLEWLPMETIAYSGCLASNRVTAELAPGAEMLGWDVLALGLAAAGQPFERGVFSQHLELPGQWLEGGRIAADDTTLLQGPVGWAGHTVAATLWFAAGTALTPARRTALVEAAREVQQGHALAATAGVTAPQAGVVVLRVLAARVEPVMQLFTAVRAAWRQQAWGLAAVPPRIWKT